MDLRDAIASGKRTVVIPTGGIEPNGPWLALGKHDYAVHATCEAIVRKLKDALCAPVIAFVPASGSDRGIGAIRIGQQTFEALVTDIAANLKTQGFERIILIGDHGGNQEGLKAVAERLSATWGGKPALVYIPEYYSSWEGADALLLQHGVSKKGVEDGIHDDPASTFHMMLIDPHTVRYEERVAIGKATINGVSIADRAKDLQWGREIVDYRATVTVEAIDKALAGCPSSRNSPRPKICGEAGKSENEKSKGTAFRNESGSLMP
jgi:creatinine amidohydrolase/Fe(II)-dependent formamide hydrolase-like protein